MEDDTNRVSAAAWTWVDWLLFVRAFVLWALLIGQAGYIGLFAAGVTLTSKLIVVCLLIGGVIGMVCETWWRSRKDD